MFQSCKQCVTCQSSEAATRGVLQKKLFLKILQYPQENKSLVKWPKLESV